MGFGLTGLSIFQAAGVGAMRRSGCNFANRTSTIRGQRIGGLDRPRGASVYGCEQNLPHERFGPTYGNTSTR